MRSSDYAEPRHIAHGHDTKILKLFISIVSDENDTNGGAASAATEEARLRALAGFQRTLLLHACKCTLFISQSIYLFYVASFCFFFLLFFFIFHSLYTLVKVSGPLFCLLLLFLSICCIAVL